jgi:hypothetical protein
MDPTEEFQLIWFTILKDQEKNLEKLEEDFKELEKLIDQGADINHEMCDEDGELKTPLLYLIEEYYYSNTSYMNDEYLDELLSFLFSKDVVIDDSSFYYSCRVSVKLYEELLKRSYDNDEEKNIEINMSSNPLCLEIATGFPNIRLDRDIPYIFSYFSKEEERLVSEEYRYLPIECVILDYVIERGSKITTDDKRKEIIKILKRQGSPNPDVENINIILDRINHSGSRYFTLNLKDPKVKENRIDRFKEIYDYFISI